MPLILNQIPFHNPDYMGPVEESGLDAEYVKRWYEREKAERE